MMIKPPAVDKDVIKCHLRQECLNRWKTCEVFCQSTRSWWVNNRTPSNEHIEAESSCGIIITGHPALRPPV